MSEKTFDIIIVGGGMVGATLACALAQTDFNVALVDARKANIDWSPEKFDLRVSAITRASQHIFENIGVWQNMQAMRTTAYTDMHVWDATGDGEIHFSSADISEPNLGHIVENSVILSSVYARLQQLDNVTLMMPCALTKLTVDEHAASLETADEQLLKAKLIIGADGARSWIREQAEITTTGWQYGQKGIVATVQTENSHQFTAWQRFLPAGPLAFLPVDERHCSIVWSTLSENADQLLQLSDAEFLHELNNALANSPLGNVIKTSSRAAFPLALQHAEKYIQNRVALVGDAAHTVHPLAGQGVNLGLLDAATLTDILVIAKTEKRDIGLTYTLRKYERARKGDNLLMLGMMDGFKRTFSNDSNGLSQLRNMGLSFTNKLTPVKNSIIRSAMGLNGEQPCLAKCLTT